MVTKPRSLRWKRGFLRAWQIAGQYNQRRSGAERSSNYDPH